MYYHDISPTEVQAEKKELNEKMNNERNIMRKQIEQQLQGMGLETDRLKGSDDNRIT